MLRKKYPRFIYNKYSWKLQGRDLNFVFDFEIEPAPTPRARSAQYETSIYFKPEVTIENVDKSRLKKIGKGMIDNLVFHLGLMEIPSYWKATCSPIIEIQAGYLNKEQISWWKDLIIKGMGQFFYENKVNFRQPNFLTLHSSPSPNVTQPCCVTLLSSAPTSEQDWSRTVLDQSNEGVLVPLGGGKDSAVTLELLKQVKKEIKINCICLSPTETAKKIMEVGNFKYPIIGWRKIDKKLLELNRQGFLNGHTPISAYFAFFTVLAAVLFDYKYIALSNERSSNEGNVKYLGQIINHQWSKSFEFEKKFRSYCRKYLAKGVEYFSFLRPLYELQIAKLFSKYPKYFSAFLSCNEAHKTASGTKKPIKKWCGNCPKCLFVYATLYPFLKKEQLLKIFGKDIFENRKLLPTMKDLLETKRIKPFECVGTKKESLVAFYLSWKKNKNGGGQTSTKIPFLLRYFEKKIMPKYPNLENESEKIINSWNRQNNLPPLLAKVLKNAIIKSAQQTVRKENDSARKPKKPTQQTRTAARTSTAAGLAVGPREYAAKSPS